MYNGRRNNKIQKVVATNMEFFSKQHTEPHSAGVEPTAAQAWIYTVAKSTPAHTMESEAGTMLRGLLQIQNNLRQEGH